MIPSLTSEKPNTASSDASATSAHATRPEPPPESTTARASPTSANASVSSAISAASKAFRRSGRASVTRSTAPSRSTRRASMAAEHRVRAMLHGALAAAVTPLADGGEALDEAAFEPYVDFLAAGGLAGLLALGTTGEGFLLPHDHRRRAAELFLEAAGGRLDVAVHCGAQSTADTVLLAAHAAEAGADAVAVIGPPYFRLDDEALAAHFEAAAAACAPTPFYLYEFERVSGYAVPLEVVARLRERLPNLAGLKVSDRPFDRVRPYLLDGLDVFVGSEPLLHEALAAGAAGAPSGGAAAVSPVGGR